jgi:hypothetical protein
LAALSTVCRNTIILPEFERPGKQSSSGALWVAVAVVAMELGAIAWIRKRYVDTPLLQAIFQVVLGGILVFLTGILVGNLG